ncbi:hypothetical protein TEGAF0_19580 [Sediminibacterium sp. TEGAF015]|nr:hypothetical protein TEGAF0_19580 [Sediminibacterium sp. TEGAF015]
MPNSLALTVTKESLIKALEKFIIEKPIPKNSTK